MDRTLPADGVQYLRDLRDARAMGYLDCLVETKQIKPDLSLLGAGRIYGEGVVQRWIDEGLIKYRQDGPRCKKRLSIIELEELNKASNRSSFMTTAERQKSHRKHL